jgi:hypothetical protein
MEDVEELFFEDLTEKAYEACRKKSLETDAQPEMLPWNELPFNTQTTLITFLRIGFMNGWEASYQFDNQ